MFHLRQPQKLYILPDQLFFMFIDKPLDPPPGFFQPVSRGLK